MKQQLYYSPYTHCFKCNVCNYKLDYSDEITLYLESRPHKNNSLQISNFFETLISSINKEKDIIDQERKEKIIRLEIQRDKEKIEFLEERDLRVKTIEKLCANAFELFKSHVLHEHTDICYDCNTCDKKFIRIKDAIKKRHNCSYKKTKLKKVIYPIFGKDVSSVILSFLD